MKGQRLVINNKLLVEIEAHAAWQIYRTIDPVDAGRNFIDIGTRLRVRYHGGLHQWMDDRNAIQS